MANRFQYGAGARRAKLDAEARRCDGNSRSCPQRAVERHTIVRSDGNGRPAPGAAAETRMTCSNHRRQYKYNAQWVYLSCERLTVKGARHVNFSRKSA